MPSEQINIKLGFSADTSAAKKSIMELQTQLQNIAKMPGTDSMLIDEVQINNASKAALELQKHLQAAVNVNTGKLDLSRFSTSLKASGKDLSSYYDSLLKIGPAGQQAFMSLSRAIATADAPVTRLNTKMQDFVSTLAKTAKWQISGDIFRSITSTISNAYSYAQDLNKSLNDIRIVTGDSADQMADFAKQANKAAKELSATTLAYTDASLIFFQQGLDNAAVTERTNAVIKMSNVTGEAVEDVSSYMTAIWNNFDGTYDQLEKYADVITALGAATASSSEEIAGGLEQFASIASTVGLSYEYATSALATVVSATRQSENVVGTAFKTIFSRLQGLSLGETLDDGVTLNKYSTALHKVGVEILDTSGNMKDLDTILDDLGSKWDTLTNAQQTALAQTVAGTRQYGQLMSLMSNWDTMQENLSIAENAEGALQEQADIYAESWEAARKRVQTAMQGIYDQLVDDDFFIKLANGLAVFIEAIGTTIEKMGGLKGILAAVGGVIISMYAKELPKALENVKQNIMVFTGTATKAMTDLQKENAKKQQGIINNPNSSEEAKASARVSLSLQEMQQKLIQSTKNLSKEEQESYKNKMANVDAMGKEAIEIAKQIDLQDKQIDSLMRKAKVEAEMNISTTTKKADNAATTANSLKEQLSTASAALQADPKNTEKKAEVDALATAYGNAKAKAEELKTEVDVLNEAYEIKGTESQEERINKINETLTTLISNYEDATQQYQRYSDLQNQSRDQVNIWEKESESIKKSSDELKNHVEKVKEWVAATKDATKGDLKGTYSGRKKIQNALDDFDNADTLEKQQAAWDKLLNAVKAYQGQIDSISSEKIKNFEKSIEDCEAEAAKLGISVETFGKLSSVLGENVSDAEKVKQILSIINAESKENIPTQKKALTQYVELGSGMMSTYSAMRSLVSLGTTLKDVFTGDASAMEMFGAIASAVMTVTMALNTASRSTIALGAAKTAITRLENKAQEQGTAAKIASWVAEKLLNTEKKKGIALSIASLGYLALIVGAITAVVFVVKALYTAWKDNTPAERLKALNAQVTELTSRYEELTQAAEDFKSAVSEYDEARAALESLDKKTQEYKESLEEANEKARELIETYGLYDAYSYSNGEITFKKGTLEEAQADRDNAAKDVKNSLYATKISQNKANLENEAAILSNSVTLSKETGDGFIDYTQASDMQSIASKVFDLSVDESGVNISLDELREKLENAGGYWANLAEQSDEVIQKFIALGKAIDESEEANKYNAQQIMQSKIADDAVVTTLANGDEALESQITAALAGMQSTQELTDELSKVSSTGSHMNVSVGAKNDEDLARIYAEEVLGYSEDEAKAMVYTADSNGKGTGSLSLEDGTSVIEGKDDNDMRNAILEERARNKIIEEQGVDTKSFEGILQNLLNSNFTSEYGANADISNAIMSAMANGGIEDMDVSSIMGGLSASEANELATMNNEEFLALVGLTPEQVESLGGETADEWVDGLQSQLKDYDPTEYLANLTTSIASSGDAISTLLSGDELSDDQISALESLEAEYEELGTIQDRTSAAYLSKLIEIREALEKEKIATEQLQQNKDIDDAIDFKISDDSLDEFQDKLKDICDSEYEILVDVKADIQDDFDAVTSTVDSITEAASKIGENFVVAGEDLEELNDVFPGILANMQDLGDGTAKLDSEIVKSAMEAADAEAQADTNATIVKLENQATELAAKRDAAQSIANIAADLAKGTKITTEAEGKLDTALSQLKSDNSEETSETQQENEVGVGQTSALVSQQMATNAANAYEQMAKDAVTYAQTAQKALKAAADPTQAIPDVGSFGGANIDTTPVSISQTSSADISEIEDYSKVDDWQKVSDYYSSLAESYDEAYNNTLGKIAELKIRGSGASDTYGNIASGKGADGGSGKDKDVEEHQETELDAYHDINRAISEVTDSMNKLDKAKEHLAGSQLVDALQIENELLEKQKKNYEDLGKVINSEAGRLQGLLSQYGVEFDETTGEMTNYVDAYNKALADYNAAIDKYNASSQEQSDKDILEKAKTAYSDFKDYVDEYDETLDKWLENEQNKLDAYYQQIENNYEAWETEINVSLDLASAQQDWNKFWQKVNKDIKGAYTDYAKELSDLTTNFNKYRDSTFATDLRAVNEIRAELDKLQAGGTSDRYASVTEAANDLLEKSNTLRDDAESLYDMYTEAWDNYLSDIDQVVDKWSAVIDKFDKINDQLEHYAQIIDLIYGGADTVAGRNYYDQLYEAQAATSLVKQGALAEEIASLEKERKELLAAGAKETDSDVKALQEAIEEANSTLSSEIESYLNTIQSKLTNAIQSIMDTADKALTQNITGNTLVERWQKSQDAAEGYYDEVQRIFEIQTMADKWQDLINSTTTIKNQQYLKTIMDAQLQNLKDKTKLSEYDIGLAEKELAIYQAQIALEEAQNNKSTMKLTRDEAGNWTYNYVADEDDVAAKQEDLLAALQEKYNYIKTSSEEATQSLLELYNTAQEELTTLLEEYKTADETRRAEIQEQYDYLYNYYYGEEGLIVQKAAETTSMQNDLNVAAMESLWGLYEVDQENFQIMTDNEQALIEALRDNSIESLRELLETVATDDGSFYNQMQEKCSEVCADSKDQWQLLADDVIANWATNPDSVRNTITDAYNQIMNKVAEYDNAIVQSEQTSGIAWSNVSNYINATSSTISGVISMIDSVINETDKLSESRKAVEDLRTAWYAVAQQIQQVAEIAAALQQTSYSGPTASNIAPVASTYAGVDATPSSNGGGSGSGGGTSKSSNSTSNSSSGGLALKDDTGPYSIMKGSSGSYYILSRSGQIVDGTRTTGYSDYSGAWQKVQLLKKANGMASAFDTGGYTGDWNNGEGKMAILHSKELVLNKDDTKNMLSAVSAVREISSLGSSITSSIANGIGNMIKSLLNLKSPSDISSTNISKSSEQSINNTFEIAMNVDGGDVEEIKTAILSLPNLASQYLSKH